MGLDKAETSSSELDETWPGPWGLEEVETSSSELDEAWLGPYGLDEVVVASLSIGLGNVTLINPLARIPGYRYLT